MRDKALSGLTDEEIAQAGAWRSLVEHACPDVAETARLRLRDLERRRVERRPKLPALLPDGELLAAPNSHGRRTTTVALARALKAELITVCPRCRGKGTERVEDAAGDVGDAYCRNCDGWGWTGWTGS